MAEHIIKTSTKQTANKPTPVYEKKLEVLTQNRHNAYAWKVEPYLHIVSDMMRNGSTEEMVMKKLGVSRETFVRYKRQHAALRDALKTRDEIDSMVEGALYQRALGYTVIESRKHYEVDKETGGLKLISLDEFVRHIPASEVATLAWLNNRRKEVWRQKQRDDFAPGQDNEPDPITKSILVHVNGDAKDEEVEG